MQWLRRSFIAGFFVTVPLFISVAAFIWIFGVVDGLTTPLYRAAARAAGSRARHPDHGARRAAGRRVGDQRHRQAAAAAGGELPAAGAGVPDDLRAGEAAGRGVFAGQRVRLQAGGDGRGRRRGYALGFLTKEFTVDRGRGREPLVAVYVPTNHLYLGDIVICERDAGDLSRTSRSRRASGSS